MAIIELITGISASEICSIIGPVLKISGPLSSFSPEGY